MSKPKTITEGIQRAFGGVLANLQTVMPAVVESFNEATGRADCAPCMGYGRRKGGERLLKFRSTIPDVPVGFFGTGGAVISVDVAKGDEVLLLFSGDSLRPWKGKRGGTKIDPKSDDRFQLEDAIAIPLVIHATQTCGIRISGGKTYIGDQITPFVEVPGPSSHQLIRGDQNDAFTGVPLSTLTVSPSKVFAK